MTDAVLSCESIDVAFGALRAVDGFGYSFRRERVHSLIGPNGAGKTTLLNALSGRVPVRRGSVKLEGREIGKLAAHERTRAGLGRSFQISQFLPGFSVMDNLRLGALVRLGRSTRWWTAATGDSEATRRAEEVLEQTGLQRLRDVPAEQLSHGDHRALEIALALITEPRVLLLDEPLAGVGHQQLDAAIALLRRIVAGRTVVLIEHNMDVVMDLSDEVLVMVQGRLLASGAPEAIRADPKVRAAYLGEPEP